MTRHYLRCLWTELAAEDDDPMTLINYNDLDLYGDYPEPDDWEDDQEPYPDHWNPEDLAEYPDDQDWSH